MVVRAGAFVQSTEAEEGLHHLIEHLLFRQGDAGSFNEDAAKLDAWTNGVTGDESVRYYMTLPSKNLSKGLSLLSSVIRKPNFGSEEIKSERAVVLGELQRHASDPNALMVNESDLLLWEGDMRRLKNPGGNYFTLQAANTAVLTAMYKKYYVPNNAALIVCGDVTDSAAFAEADRVFKGWKAGPDPLAGLKLPPVQPLTSVKFKFVTQEVRDVSFLIRWHGPSVKNDADATYAADVLAGLVNQRVSGTQKRLVDGGLMDNVSMNYETLNNVGPIELRARTSADRAEAATEALGAELSKLVAPDAYDLEDLGLAKKSQRVGTHFALENGTATAHWVAAVWASAGLEYFMSYSDRVEAQSLDNVRLYIKQYLAARPMAVTVLLSQETWSKSGTGIQQALRQWSAP